MAHYGKSGTKLSHRKENIVFGNLTEKFQKLIFLGPVTSILT